MAVNLTKKRPQDASKINIHAPYEVDYWTDAFGVTKALFHAKIYQPIRV
ncbi:MAG: DUF3606 domain-containing protein [Clostridiaceae bacterium]|nr:DUF3606 domain-containing protein [Clostridiaceae bacterium]